MDLAFDCKPQNPIIIHNSLLRRSRDKSKIHSSQSDFWIKCCTKSKNKSIPNRIFEYKDLGFAVQNPIPSSFWSSRCCAPHYLSRGTIDVENAKSIAPTTCVDGGIPFNSQNSKMRRVGVSNEVSTPFRTPSHAVLDNYAQETGAFSFALTSQSSHRFEDVTKFLLHFRVFMYVLVRSEFRGVAGYSAQNTL